MFRSVKYVEAMIAVILLVSSGVALSASLIPGTSCSTANLTTSTQCSGIYSGNDSEAAVDGLFGIDWNFETKVEGYNGSAGGLTISSSTKTEGQWAFDMSGYSDVMFVLKGGPTFTAYLMDTNIGSGDWKTLDLLKGGDPTKPGPDLSHFSVYTVSAVPLPAAAWLFGSALLGFIGFKKFNVRSKTPVA